MPVMNSVLDNTIPSGCSTNSREIECEKECLFGDTLRVYTSRYM